MEETNNVDTATENQSQAAGADGGTNGQTATATSETKTADTVQATEGTNPPEGNLLTGATDEAKGEKPEGEEKKPDEEKKEQPQGAPETYADFKAPEGREFDGSIINAFKTAAKDANLSQDAAQKLLDEMGPVIEKRQMQQVQEISEQWKQRSLSDKELSADSKATSAYIARVRDRFSVNADGEVDPDIKEFMSLPIGNHPGCLKLLARMGRAISEAGFPRGGAGGKETITPKEFYQSAKGE